MGEKVAAVDFTREDRQRYREKIKRSLDVFARMLSESRFDAEHRSIGLEIELNLTDECGDPAMKNAAALEAIADEGFQTELGQFNVEINIPPRLISGEIAGELEAAVRRDLNHAEERARTVGAHMVMIGILPTLQELKAQGVRPRVWFGERWITSIFDLFEENVRYFPALLPVCEDEDPVATYERGDIPELAELRLHNGTIYRWNRPVYDTVRGMPHLRVENRVLPAGPTVGDILANAA